MNFMSRSTTSKKILPGKTEFNQALQLYNSVQRRLKSRFMFFGKVLGKVVLISSARFPGDFFRKA